MRYTIVGRWRDGRSYTVTWEAGRLSGDPVAVALVRATALGLEGHAVGPVSGPYTERDHLVDPLSTLVLMCERVFESIESAEGEVPVAPDVPEGAVP